MVEVELKPLLKRLNRYGTQVLEGAAGLCISRGHYEVTVEHMLLKMCDDPGADLSMILDHFDAELSRVQRSLQRAVEELRSGNAGKPVFSPILVQWIQDGWVLSSIEFSLEQVRSGALVAVATAQSGRFLSSDHPELEKVRADELRHGFKDIVAGSSEEAAMIADSARGAAAHAVPAGGAAPGAPETALGRFAINFTQQARDGRIDPVFGRDREIRQMVDILARRRKNNPIVVGEAGVGKTAVVEGLALRIAQDDVPDLLKGVEIFSLDMALLQAGAGVKGEFENRLKSVIQEVKQSPTPLIMFIDEAHTMIGAGGPAGGSDAANLLKPALARGELRTIAATTWAEYKKHIEEDPALARRFQPVKLDEPSVDDTAVILRGLRKKYEEVHGVMVRDDAVAAAATLSSRYITGRYLPDKAVDLMDTSAARVKIGLSSRPPGLEDLERKIQTLQRELDALERDREGGVEIDAERVDELRKAIASTREQLGKDEAAWRREKEAVDRVLELRHALAGEPAPKKPALSPAKAKKDLDSALKKLRGIQGDEPTIRMEVDPEVVARVIGDWTGIPVGRMVQDEATTILELEDRLRDRIKGQDHAIHAIAEVLRAAKAGIRDPGKPMGVFMLAGPSGVGKSETALAVADLIFGGERFMTTINMSEYQDGEMGISGLIGARPGYVGYGKGGTLTEGVRQRPYSVVLLDEIEKAASEVRNMFFQVFDKGMLTDGTGRDIDFKNTVIFITSNVGLDLIQQMCAASPAPDPEEILTAVRPQLSDVLTPAWLARTTVIPYLTLPHDALRLITGLKVNKVAKRLRESHKIELAYGDDVLDAIADRCAEVETGARNIDHILEGTLQPRISVAILEKMAEGPLPDRMVVQPGEDGGFDVAFEDE
jgi:type VI secretion system protein VasG